MKPFIFILIVLAAFVCIKVTGSDQISPPPRKGHCPKFVRGVFSYSVPYIETYRKTWGFFYQTKTRTNYRTQFITKWEMKDECCEGYVMHIDTCKPKCTDGCVNGNCTDPNVCTCNPGYTPSDDEKTSHYLCEPRCRGTCDNGKCTAPDVCKCNQGYELAESKQECMPICEENCEAFNAYCAAPDTCACDRGYMTVAITENLSRCKPVCEEPCINGNCTAPNVCSCNDGYEKDSDSLFLCSPICNDSCIYGNCVAPNTCKCNDGYRARNESVCEPICSEPCKMGSCIAPESCSCEEGYGLTDSSRYVCQPICNKACVNGVCTAPGVCTCNEGFWFNGSLEEDRICKPYCKVSCEPYGRCIAPGRCLCMDGYREISPESSENDISERNITEEAYGACMPICSETCINARCTAPNTCTCNPGYSKSNSTDICEPFCESSCASNSTCTQPNICTCNSGYQPIEGNVAKGCEPICELPCGQNSTCTAPNVCTCNEGYTKDFNGSCIPFCTNPCQNASCIEPETCRCYEGFASKNETVCIPVCNDCENGECIAPNHCQCHVGFATDNGTCVKLCTRDCNGHGRCLDEKEPCECSFGWTGWNCNENAFCIFAADWGDGYENNITVSGGANSSVTEIFETPKFCFRCGKDLDNETLCYNVSMPMEDTEIWCLLSADLPCYTMYIEAQALEVFKVAGSVAAATILIIVSAITTAYYFFRRSRKKEIHTVSARTVEFRGSISDVTLITEEEVCTNFHTEL